MSKQSSTSLTLYYDIVILCHQLRNEIRKKNMDQETERRTYPGLGYSLGVRKVAANCGWLLGRVCARVEQVRRSILPPAVADVLRADVRIRGISALATLAGNTLGEASLRQLLTDQLEVPPSREYLRQELVNQVAAEEALGDERGQDASPLATSELLARHAALLRDLQLHGLAPAGALRREEQEFQGHRGVAPADIAPQLERLSGSLQELHEPFQAAFGLGGGILRALLAHRYLLWIRPFPIANGRVARLVEQEILRCSGVPATVSLLLPIHYLLTRTAYTAQLAAPPDTPDEASVFAFLRYALQGLHDSLAELINRMDESHLLTHWGRHVNLILGEDERTTNERKLQIMAAISDQKSAVKRDKVPQLSPILAAAYAKVSDRTLRRDIQDLLRVGLLEESKAGLRARKEQLYAFLPEVE